MKALLVLAAMLAEPESARWAAVGSGGQEWAAVGGDDWSAIPQPPLRAIEEHKPGVVVFAPYTSARAGTELRSVLALQDEFEFDVKLDPAAFPEWVRTKADTSDKFPLLWWKAGPDDWRASGWATGSNFREQYLESLDDQPAKVSSKLPAANSGISRRGYPVHAGMQWNVEGDWRPSRATLINHLLSHPNHRAKFDRAWLDSLSLQELTSLHDDDHNHRVAAAGRPQQVQQPQRYLVPVFGNVFGSCPNGRCRFPK